MTRKKHTASEDSLVESELVIENDNSHCSSITHVSIEDFNTPLGDSLPIKNSPSKKRKNPCMENKIDSGVSELSASKIKKKKKNHKDNQGTLCNTSNMDLDNENIIENDKHKKSPRKIGVKKEIDIIDGESCSIFSSESFTRSNYETNGNCVQNFGNILSNEFREKKKKRRDSSCEIEDVLSHSAGSVSMNNSPFKKKKKRLKENKIDDELTVNSLNEMITKHKCILESINDNLSENLCDGYNDLGNEQQKKRKKKHRDSSCKIEDVSSYSAESALTNNSPFKKKKKRSKENKIDDELTANSSNEIKTKHKFVLENINVNISENMCDEYNDLGNEHLKKRKKKKSKNHSEHIEHPQKIGDMEGMAINEDDFRQYSKNVYDENNELGNEKRKKIKSKNNSEHMDYPEKIGDMAEMAINDNDTIYATFKKGKKEDHEKPRKKSKKLMSDENISIDENNCKTGESDNSIYFSDTGKRKKVEENANNTKKKCLSDFISSSLMDGLKSKMDEIIRAESQGTGFKERETDKNKGKKKDEEHNGVDRDDALVNGDSTINIKKDRHKLKEINEEIECSPDFISPSLTDNIIETKSRRKKSKNKERSKNRVKSPPGSDLHKILGASEGTELIAIPDADLNDLLAQFEEIVENEERTSRSVEEILEEVSQRNKGADKKERKQNIEEKKKILELFKKTKSIEKIREELNIKDDEGLEKLKDLKITIPWPLARVHQIARNVSSQPTQAQRDALEDAGIKLRLGVYSVAEDEKIKENWKKFCKLHDWDENNYHPFVKGSNFKKYGVLDRTNYRKFVKFISHNFENRLMYNIYLRFKRLFTQNDTEHDTFTPEDDQIINEYVKSNAGNEPFADLAVLLKRPRLAILKRYQRLKALNLYHKGRIIWNEDLCRELIYHLLRVTGSKRLSDLKNRHITMQEWGNIAEKMGIPPHKLRRAWETDFYTRLINPLYDELYEENKCKLMHILAEDYTDRREIDFVKVAKKFDNSIAPLRLHKMFKDIIRDVPKPQQTDLPACLEHFKRMKKRFSARPRCTYVTKIFEEIENDERNRQETDTSDSSDEYIQ